VISEKLIAVFLNLSVLSTVFSAEKFANSFLSLYVRSADILANTVLLGKCTSNHACMCKWFRPPPGRAHPGDAEVVDVVCDAAIPLDGRVLLPQPC
jgi:hypothetical protein